MCARQTESLSIKHRCVLGKQSFCPSNISVVLGKQSLWTFFPRSCTRPGCLDLVVVLAQGASISLLPRSVRQTKEGGNNEAIYQARWYLGTSCYFWLSEAAFLLLPSAHRSQRKLSLQQCTLFNNKRDFRCTVNTLHFLADCLCSLLQWYRRTKITILLERCENVKTAEHWYKPEDI